jgi:hypothetical protein
MDTITITQQNFAQKMDILYQYVLQKKWCTIAIHDAESLQDEINFDTAATSPHTKKLFTKLSTAVSLWK